MNQNENMNFRDPQTITAIILVFVIFIGWNFYMRQKYPEISGQKPPVATDKSPTTEAGDVVDSRGQIPQRAVEPAETMVKFVSEETDLRSTKYSASLENLGLNIRGVTLDDYLDREKSPYRFGDPTYGSLLIKDASGRKIPFQFTRKEKNFVEATHTDRDGIVYRASINFNAYDFDLRLLVEGNGFRGLQIEAIDKIEKPKSAGILDYVMPQFAQNEVYFLLNDGSEERISFSSPTSASFPAASVFAIDSQYFAYGFVDSSPIMPSVNMEASETSVRVLAEYKPISKSDGFSVNLKGYFGPKDTGILASVDKRLENTINFGMFSFLARPLLTLLRWFHGVTGNWGIAIILMTIIVKLAVLPFNLMAYKSMKAMQKIQPQMASIREKYKDDQARQQQEIMNLMRTHKVNPVGGCLPMLLQLPVFIALYQVLGQSIELYQAPFFGWIADLSEYDPFFVLPILMGITMFFQMRMTPSTMDPMQAKIMSFMPVLFTFLMVRLPSGLTLYIFVSTLFTVVQQMFFMRDRNEAVATQSARA